MAQDEPATPLEALLRRFRYRPNRFLRRMAVVARRFGLRTITRQQFFNIRTGRGKATESTIYLIVATFREMSGLMIRAAEIFRIEPAPGTAGAPRSIPLSSPSGCRAGSLWMPDDEAPRESMSAHLERIYNEHAALLRSTARFRHNIPPEDVDELVHDVFASFLERRPRVDDMRAYLLGATNNACMYYWRKRKHESPLLEEHDQVADDSTARRADRWAIRVSLGATLAQLGPKCRETLHRFYVANEKPEAIARGLQTTRGYVFQLLHTCRKRAREIYIRITEPRR